MIDDDKVSNLIVCRQIVNANKNVRITEFEDAQQALIYLTNPKNEHPDAILLDLFMPKADGWQFLELLKKSCLSIPIYIITVSLQPKDRRKARQYENVKNFFNKPLETNSIQALI